MGEHDIPYVVATIVLAGLLVAMVCAFIESSRERKKVASEGTSHSLKPIGFQEFECSFCKQRVCGIAPTTMTAGVYGYLDWPLRCPAKTALRIAVDGDL